MKEMESRRSIRKYRDRPVDEEAVRKLMESARLAPSGTNTQPWHFIVITDPEVKAEVVAASHHQRWMLSAPVFIACVADPAARMEPAEGFTADEHSPEMAVKQVIRDTAIAAEHLVLEAEALGLGTCWVAWFEQKDIKAVLGIPRDKFTVAVITVGYADEDPKPRKRKPLEEILHTDRW